MLVVGRLYPGLGNRSVFYPYSSVGITFTFYLASSAPQIAAATWRVLCASVYLLFPWFFVLLCLHVVVLCFFSSFFSSVCHIPCGEARQFFPRCFLLLFRFVFYFLSCFCFVCFLSFIEYVRRACRIRYPV